jgi:acyl-CoA reductase-like NAD-dependent aldehyde dehydrogenase
MSRLEVAKTYKLYIGGKFPRTESGRTFKLNRADGSLLANVCQASRKDFREAVVSARKAQSGWAGKTAYNRSQILYRLAEMLEGRSDEFAALSREAGASKAQADKDIQASIDCLVHYAGWADKYQQVFSSVNPVASSHFNFSVLEPTGVVTILAPQTSSLAPSILALSAAISGGNSVIILASEETSALMMTLAEVIHTSDVPGGVINILTGHQAELGEHMARHMDVNALVYCGEEAKFKTQLKEWSTENVKRFVHWPELEGKFEYSPYYIRDLQEVKTTWHPIEKITTSGSGY